MATIRIKTELKKEIISYFSEQPDQDQWNDKLDSIISKYLSKLSQKRPKDENAPKKACSAYMFFSEWARKTANAHFEKKPNSHDLYLKLVELFSNELEKGEEKEKESELKEEGDNIQPKDVMTLLGRVWKAFQFLEKNGTKKEKTSIKKKLATWRKKETADKKRYSKEKKEYTPSKEYLQTVEEWERANGKNPKPKRPVDENAPKKPLTGYMQFCRATRKTINKPLAGRDLGRLWSNLTDEQRTKYNEKYQQENEKYKEELESYAPSPEFEREMEEYKVKLEEWSKGKSKTEQSNRKGKKNARHVFFAEKKESFPNSKGKELNNLLSDAWRNLSDEEKRTYREKAKAINERRESEEENEEEENEEEMSMSE